MVINSPEEEENQDYAYSYADPELPVHPKISFAFRTSCLICSTRASGVGKATSSLILSIKSRSTFSPYISELKSNMWASTEKGSSGNVGCLPTLATALYLFPFNTRTEA